MPATLSHLSAGKGVLTHMFDDGESVTIEYRPGKITPRQIRQAQAMRRIEAKDAPLSEDEQNEQLDSITKLLASVLVNWDLLDDQGEPIPPTLDGLQDVDYAAQATILQWIVEDQKPGKSNGSAKSPASSTPISESQALAKTTRSSRRSQTGTPTGV